MMLNQRARNPEDSIRAVKASTNTIVSGQAGLSLLESLVVIAIISIVTMIGTPIYQNYALRTKVSGDLLAMDPVKKLVSEEYAINDIWPINNEQARAKEPTTYSGTYLQSVEVTNTPVDGSILLTYNVNVLPALTGRNTIIFYPTVTTTQVIWSCDRGSIPKKYRPARCR